MIDLKAARYRANPGYEAVPFNRLSDGDGAPTDRADAASADLYGVLRPRRGQGLPFQLVCKETALLFLSLQSPGPLPSYLLSQGSPGVLREVERLVLDEVIQVEGPQGFLTGPAALALLRGSVEEGASHLAALSYDALRYGQALALTDAPRLGMKLYTYHSLPATPRWTRLLGSPQHARTFLGLGAGGRHLGITRRLWRELEASPGWIHLQERTRSDARRADTYKLYLSPLPEDLAALLGEIAQVLATGGATQFKVGSSMAGLLRPDKLVAYFPDKETLLRTAEVLKGRLSGAGAQGVPFTAQIDDRGLISWGSDPPARIAAGRDSWRTWVVYRLAMAMVTATKQGSNPVAPWRFALARIALDGVDTRTFAPTGEWAEADAA